jgi:hypothetical protein
LLFLKTVMAFGGEGISRGGREKEQILRMKRMEYAK